MDQKKTLWIIAAVGAFLLVVIGTAVFMYSPEKNQKTVASTTLPKQDKAPDNYSGWTNPPETNNQPVPLPPQPNTAETQGMVVFSDNTNVYSMSDTSEPGSTTIDLNTLKQQLALEDYANANAAEPSNTTASQPQNINITVNLPETTVTVNDTAKPEGNNYYVGGNSKAVTKAPETETKPAVAKPASSSTKTAAAPAKTNTTVKTTAPAPASKPVTQYWVQVAAYSNKKGAENARSILDENKIPSDVFTYEDNKNKLFYRVRVGPYTTKSEAEYWKSKIVKINDFAKAESYVTSTTTK